MIRAVPILTVAAAYALAGCSQEPTQPSAEGTGTPAVAQTSEPAIVEPFSPPEAVESLPAAPAPSADASATTTATAIPAAIRGRWGLVPADCTSKLGDAKGLLTISSSQLKFYESVAKLGTVKEAEDSRIRATFAYSGEGQTWTQDVVLDVQDGGKTLIRRDYGRDALPGPLKYARCN
jgi:hypothetical protein